ncbi:MAG: MgtC/SapB family protein [Myxococcaceae bacterium]
MDELTLSLRILLAAVLAGLLGLEREWKRQYAGFRTHILVSLGSCLFTLVGTYAFLPDPAMNTASMSVDPTRVPSQVVVGIGFLGGGAILKYGMSIKGLTTAANLWLAAAVGMAVGVGYYFAAVACVAMSLLTLVGLRPLEHKLFPETLKEDQREKRQRKAEVEESPETHVH